MYIIDCYRLEMDEWVLVIEDMLLSSKRACVWMVEYIASEEGSSYIKYVHHFNYWDYA